MNLIVASGNQGKLHEISEIFSHHRVMSFREFLAPFEIIEDGNSFQENAFIKARAIAEKLPPHIMRTHVILSDDSGLCVPILGGAPGIYSARYAGENASDEENNKRLIRALKERGIERTSAYYVAAIAMIFRGMEWSTHGWLHGEVITTPRGKEGFGYDPLFIPKGYDMSLAEMEKAQKNKISHRFWGLKRAEFLLGTTAIPIRSFIKNTSKMCYPQVLLQQESGVDHE